MIYLIYNRQQGFYTPSTVPISRGADKRWDVSWKSGWIVHPEFGGATSMTLIVEDDPVFLRIMKEILSTGFPSISLIEAANGTQALEQFNAWNPRLVFMDISLPDINGLKLTKRMKESNPEVIVVIVTNHDTPEHREAAYEAGADSFVSKSSNVATEVQTAVRSLAPWASHK